MEIFVKSVEGASSLSYTERFSVSWLPISDMVYVEQWEDL